MKHRLVLGLIMMALALAGAGLGNRGAGAAVARPLPGDIIIDDESPMCPAGGPIFRLSSGNLTVLAQGSPVQKPRGNTIDAQGNLIVADGVAGLLKVDLDSGVVTTIAAKPPYQPRDVVIDGQGNFIVVDWPDASPPQGPPAVYRITPAGQVSVIAQGVPLEGPHGVALDANGNYIIADNKTGIIRVTPLGQMTLVKSSGMSTGLGVPADVRVDVTGDYIVADLAAAVLRVSPGGTMSVIKRGAPFSTVDPATQTGGPRGLIIESSGDYLVVDQRAKTVFRVTPQGGVTNVFSGGALCGPSDLTMYQASPPVPQSPPSGAMLSGLGTTLSWTLPTGTTQYQIQVAPANNDGPAINLIRATETTFVVQPPAMGQGPYLWLPDMTYGWRVRATSSFSFAPENDPSWGPWSATQTFHTAARDSSKITAVSPGGGATVTSGVQAVQWDNGDKDVFYYEVQMSGDTRFDASPDTATSFVWWNLVHGGVTSPLQSWQTPVLDPNTTYYWRVRPRVQGDGTPAAWSQVFTFKTGP